jgi:hypothetical protein
MSAPKIASLFCLAGALGLIVAVLVGTSQRTEYLLDVSFACIALGGLTVLLHVLRNLWSDFTESDNPHRPRS